MLKVGDKVKYAYETTGRVIYGIIEEVHDGYYPYYVYYNGDGYKFYDWESDETIELVEKCSSVDDDVKFRAFLEEVANVNYIGYDEEYSMLEKIMNSDFGETEKKEAIKELCDFYKDFNYRKRMTVEEIEKELGYKIEVVE